MTRVWPPTFVRGYNFKNLTDEQTHELQNWCVKHVKPSWLTGIGLMDAAESQVQEAVDNGNIPPDSECSTPKTCGVCHHCQLPLKDGVCPVCPPPKKIKPPASKPAASKTGASPQRAPRRSK